MVTGYEKMQSFLKMILSFLLVLALLIEAAFLAIADSFTDPAQMAGILCRRNAGWRNRIFILIGAP